MSGEITSDAKWAAIQDHYQQAYKVRFAAKPNEVVINYLYGEYLKFKETLRWLLKQSPELEQKIDLTVGQKICKSKKPRLLVLQNLPKEYPDEFKPI